MSSHRSDKDRQSQRRSSERDTQTDKRRKRCRHTSNWVHWWPICNRTVNAARSEIHPWSFDTTTRWWHSNTSAMSWKKFSTVRNFIVINSIMHAVGEWHMKQLNMKKNQSLYATRQTRLIKFYRDGSFTICLLLVCLSVRLPVKQCADGERFCFARRALLICSVVCISVCLMVAHAERATKSIKRWLNIAVSVIASAVWRTSCIWTIIIISIASAVLRFCKNADPNWPITAQINWPISVDSIHIFTESAAILFEEKNCYWIIFSTAIH